MNYIINEIGSISASTGMTPAALAIAIVGLIVLVNVSLYYRVCG